MRPDVKRAARVAPEAARRTALDTSNDTVGTGDPQAGKWLAVALYTCGARSLSATQVAFARHPSWCSA